MHDTPLLSQVVELVERVRLVFSKKAPVADMLLREPRISVTCEAVTMQMLPCVTDRAVYLLERQ